MFSKNTLMVCIFFKTQVEEYRLSPVMHCALYCAVKRLRATRMCGDKCWLQHMLWLSHSLWTHKKHQNSAPTKAALCWWQGFESCCGPVCLMPPCRKELPSFSAISVLIWFLHRVNQTCPRSLNLTEFASFTKALIQINRGFVLSLAYKLLIKLLGKEWGFS